MGFVGLNGICGIGTRASRSQAILVAGFLHLISRSHYKYFDQRRTRRVIV